VSSVQLGMSSARVPCPTLPNPLMTPSGRAAPCPLSLLTPLASPKKSYSFFRVHVTCLPFPDPPRRSPLFSDVPASSAHITTLVPNSRSSIPRSLMENLSCLAKPCLLLG
jgi:hypothetical protein